MNTPRTECIVCHRCTCARCHPKDPCEAIDRGRRIFLLGALALPLAPRLVLPPAPVTYTVSYNAIRLTYETDVSSWSAAAVTQAVNAIMADFKAMGPYFGARP